MDKTVIGLDFGSDSVRALLVDVSTGKELATAVHGYRRWGEGKYCTLTENSFRQHPLDYLEGLESVIKAVLKYQTPSLVAGIGIDTTGSTPCAVDEKGMPLSLNPEFAENPNAMFVLWKDHTAIEAAAEINRYAKFHGGIDYTMYEGGTYSSEWFWAKILNILRVDKKVREAAFSWVEHCDWITSILTGQNNPLAIKRSRCAAGHKAMWHESWGGLPPDDFLKGIDPLLAGLKARLYRETYTSDVKAGNLSAEWAQRLGLSTNVAVGVGGFDCHFGAVGACIKPGQMVKVIGTSTCDIIVAHGINKRVRGICGQVDGSVIPGMVGLEAGQSAFGDVYAWFKRLLSWSRKDVSLSELEAEASRIPSGSNGIFALDWFNGRRTPEANQHLTGTLFGLDLGSSAPMIYRALIESTAFGARKITEHFKREGIPINSIAAVGGITKNSPLVMQICADVINMPIRIVKSDQACALGGAMFAAVNAGIYVRIEDAMDAMCSGHDAIYEPNPASAGIYDSLYKKYCLHAKIVEKEVMYEIRCS